VLFSRLAGLEDNGLGLGLDSVSDW